MREADFQDWLRQAARLFNWKYMHVHDSRHGVAGWPDAFLVKGNRAIAAELKTGKREPTTEQIQWLFALNQVPGIESYVWYPHDRPRIEQLLKAGPDD